MLSFSFFVGNKTDDNQSEGAFLYVAGMEIVVSFSKLEDSDIKRWIILNLIHILQSFTSDFALFPILRKKNTANLLQALRKYLCDIPLNWLIIVDRNNSDSSLVIETNNSD